MSGRGVSLQDFLIGPREIPGEARDHEELKTHAFGLFLARALVGLRSRASMLARRRRLAWEERPSCAAGQSDPREFVFVAYG